MTEPLLRVTGLTKTFGGVAAVNDVSLELMPGKIVGLIGPNGAGKTTLISMLSSLLKPTSGSFTIDGLNYKDNQKQLKRLIGTVPQEYALYPSLTAYENLMYFGSMYDIGKSKLKNDIQFHLETLGLLEFAHKKIITFSGGMKRRVNLIAGILHHPKVLFLDEPTVGVDVQSRNVIIAHLKQLNAGGTTIIYTSHHLNEAEEFCNKVAIIDYGKIVCEGEPKNLIAAHDNARHLEDVFLEKTGKALRDYA